MSLWPHIPKWFLFCIAVVKSFDSIRSLCFELKVPKPSRPKFSWQRQLPASFRSMEAQGPGFGAINHPALELFKTFKQHCSVSHRHKLCQRRGAKQQQQPCDSYVIRMSPMYGAAFFKDWNSGRPVKRQANQLRQGDCN